MNIWLMEGRMKDEGRNGRNGMDQMEWKMDHEGRKDRTARWTKNGTLDVTGDEIVCTGISRSMDV